MTDFFPLRPFGRETVDIESINSIFVRVASAHSVPLSQLSRFLSAWWNSRNPGQETKLDNGLIFLGPAASLGGHGRSISKHVRVLSEALSFPELRRTTMLALGPAASATCAGLGKKGRAWCSACLEDALRTGESFYDKLIWQFRGLDRCVSHRIRLDENCPCCDARQVAYSSTCDLSQCWRCHESLQHPVESRTPMLQPCFGERDCCDLVLAIAEGRLIEAVPCAFRLFDDELERILSPWVRAVRKVSRPRDKRLVPSGTSLPNMQTMLKRVHIAGVSLVDVLMSPLETARVAGQLELERMDVPSTSKPRRSPNALSSARERLTSLLEKDEEIEVPSFKSLVLELQVSEGFIRHQMGDLVRAYIRRRQRWLGRLFSERRTRIRRKLKGGLLSDYLTGKIASQDHVVSELVSTCEVGISFARRELEFALRNAKREMSHS